MEDSLPTSISGPSVYRKVNWKILPLFSLIAGFCYLDRTNLAFASLQLNRDLGFNAQVYGLGSGMFFLGYSLFMVPSNMIMVKVGAPRWLGLLVVTWGLVAACFAALSSPTEFYTLRFLLGVAEAGAFPGMWFYLYMFYPPELMTMPLAVLEAAVSTANVLSAPLAAALLQLQGAGGMAGWQWLFLIEGLGTTALGLCTAALLPLGLATATFLTSSERSWLAQRVGGASAGEKQAPSQGTSPLQQHLLAAPPTRKGSSSHLYKPTASTRQSGDPSISAGSEGGTAGGSTATADPAYYPPSEDDDDAKAKDAMTYDGAGGWTALAEAGCNWRLWYVSFMGLLKNMAAHGILFWAPIINKALLEGQDLDPRGVKLDWEHHRSGSVVTAAAAPLGAGAAGEVDVAGAGAADADEPAARVQAVSTFAVLLTGIPFACAAGMAIWLGRRSQARRERSMHLAVPYAVGAVLLATLPLLAAESPVLGFIAVSIAVACVQGTNGVINSVVPLVCAPSTVSVSLALYNAVANLGGLLGPWLIGELVWYSGGYGSAFRMLGVLMGCSAIMAWRTRRWPRVGGGAGAGPGAAGGGKGAAGGSGEGLRAGRG